MKQLQQIFKLALSQEKTVAEISLRDKDNQILLDDCTWTKRDVTQFLASKQITFGLITENINHLLESVTTCTFPMIIAKGKPKQDGKDGYMTYYYDHSTEVDRTDGWDYREVMRIPVAKEGDRLAKMMSPTDGIHGRTVQNKVWKAEPGKPCQVKASKNVAFDQADQCFYAKVEGQVKCDGTSIQIHNVYEVNENISFKVGNIDFNGTVVIRGDVPSGFSIKASADIKVFGLVEAATLQAGGSVYISEGIVGKKKGKVIAGEDIYIGYVNQGYLEANHGIYIEQSTLHSICNAKTEIICDKGNIIGGKLSSGYKIKAKEIGNRLDTHTVLSFNMDPINYELLEDLKKRRIALQDDLRKMDVLYSKLKTTDIKDQKTLKTLDKLKNSYQKTKNQLIKIKESEVTTMDTGEEMSNAYLYVKGTIYPNSIVSFGKYKQRIAKEYSSVLFKIEQNDIIIEPLNKKKGQHDIM